MDHNQMTITRAEDDDRHHTGYGGSSHVQSETISSQTHKRHREKILETERPRKRPRQQVDNAELAALLSSERVYLLSRCSSRELKLALFRHDLEQLKPKLKETIEGIQGLAAELKDASDPKAQELQRNLQTVELDIQALATQSRRRAWCPTKEKFIQDEEDTHTDQIAQEKGKTNVGYTEKEKTEELVPVQDLTPTESKMSQDQHCNKKRKRADSQVIIRDKHTRKKPSLSLDEEDNSIRITTSRETIFTALGKQAFSSNTLHQSERLQIEPEEQEQNQNKENTHDQLPDDLDINKIAQNKSEETESCLEIQDGDVYKNDIKEDTITAPLPPQEEPATHADDNPKGVEVDDEINSDTDLASLVEQI
ncbi:MAG: hypothetical protein Q9214_006578, partial [Letrouitia sp. 1 TL-2023]